MLRVLVILFGSGCAPEYEFVVPSQMAIFLDPSEANREAVTTEFVSKALPKLRNCELVTRLGTYPGVDGGGTCFRRAMTPLRGYADPEIMARGLEEQTAFYQTCVEKLGLKENSGPKRKISDLEPHLLELSTASSAREFFLPDENELPWGKTPKAVRRREEALEKARSTCTDPAAEKTCPGRALLIRAADPIVEKALPTLPPGSQSWFDLHKQKSDRLGLLAAALDRPLSGKRNTADDFFVLNAMKEIFLGERDPRLWDPAELAVLVLSARKRPGGEGLFAPQNGGEAFLRLGERMGFARANELLRRFPKDFFDTRLSSQLLPDYRHFATEQLAYKDEWEARKIDPATAKLKRWSQTRGGETEAQFLIRRWHETDESAPHPDIDRVLQLADKWEREGRP